MVFVVHQVHHHAFHPNAIRLSRVLGENCWMGNPVHSSTHHIDSADRVAPAVRGLPFLGCGLHRALFREESSRSQTSANSCCCRSSSWIADGGPQTHNWDCLHLLSSSRSVARPAATAHHAVTVLAATGSWCWRWRPRSCGRWIFLACRDSGSRRAGSRGASCHQSIAFCVDRGRPLLHLR